MNANFPRILNQLRRERGISQKQAAMDLEVSQALLSHYEKGIRECGLDFVVRVADYYNVSCDYLLGRISDKTGITITVEEIPEDDPAIQDKRLVQNTDLTATMNKKIILNSVQVLFDLVGKCNDKELTAEASNALMQVVYSLFRQLYRANGHNPEGLFSVKPYLFQAASAGSIARSVAVFGQLATELEEGKAPAVLPDDLTAQYPRLAQSLLRALFTAEEKLNGKPAKAQAK